jgi:mRNA-degrading endonuclease RelE of RelBE toxin-antitoxin system
MKVEYLPEFQQALQELDKSEVLLVKKKIDQLSSSPKPLGLPLRGGLHGFYKLRCGKNARLRIVYLVKSQVCLLMGLGPREKSQVYFDAQQLASKLGLNFDK